MYAVIETGGKQYKVTEGDFIYIEKTEIPEDGNVIFERVLSVIDGENIDIGVPYVVGAKVEGTFIKNGKSKKIMIFKFKAKKNYRKRQGHRQPYTKIQINKITV